MYKNYNKTTGVLAVILKRQIIFCWLKFHIGTLKKYWQEGANYAFNGYIEPWTILPQFF